MESAVKNKWVLRATVVIVVAYAWMSAHLSEPRLALPRAIGHAVWLEHGKARSARKIDLGGTSHFREWTHIFGELNRLSHELYLFGEFDLPVSIVINADSPRAYAISERRVELGSDIAMADGQILKAIAKAWLLQSSSQWLQGSQLRIEVVSDVIVGMVRGHFRLGIPGTEGAGALTYEAPVNWLAYARSYPSSCGDAWLPQELASFCGSSAKLNPLLFRPLLGAMIFSTFKSVSPLQRLHFAQVWMESLKQERPYQDERAVSLVDWKSSLRRDLAGLLHAESLASEWPELPGVVEKQIKWVGLAAESGLRVDLVMKSSDTATTEWQSGTDLAPADGAAETSTRLLIAVATDDGYTLEPTHLPLTEVDLVSLKSEQFVWGGCRSPEIGEALVEGKGAKAILYIPCTPNQVVRLRGLVKAGIEVFALENRTLPFIQLGRDALALAVHKKILRDSTLLGVLMASGNEMFSPLLGLERPKWSARAQAYQVLGAIEAVEWFRAPAAKKTVAQTP